MNLSLPTLQKLIVFSALAWACVPTWGGLAFGASVVLLAIGTRARNRQARAVLEQHLDRLGALDPEALALARRFPLATVWPSTAERWGTTWQMMGLLGVFVGAVFVLWALGTQQWWHFWLVLAAGAQLIVGGGVARTIKLNERVTEDLQGNKGHHDKMVTLLRLKAATGQWPPVPSPDPEPASEEKKGA